MPPSRTPKTQEFCKTELWVAVCWPVELKRPPCWDLVRKKQICWPEGGEWQSRALKVVHLCHHVRKKPGLVSSAGEPVRLKGHKE